MRGQRARLNDRDGEVDENFWAQAAADQAAGRRADDEDPGVYLSLPFHLSSPRSPVSAHLTKFLDWL